MIPWTTHCKIYICHLILSFITSNYDICAIDEYHKPQLKMVTILSQGLRM